MNKRLALIAAATLSVAAASFAWLRAPVVEGPEGPLPPAQARRA